MSSQGVSNQPATGSVQTGQRGPGFLQSLVDEVAAFNIYVVPDGKRGDAAVKTPGGNITGVRTSEVLRRFDIELQRPGSETGVRAANAVGEAAGRIDLRWTIIPYDFMAAPDREPASAQLDASRSQRFAMQEMTFAFNDNQDGFRSFGTGRTFPMIAGDRPKLLAAAVGNITEGFGKFRGHEGNFTLCGELTSDLGFLGHIVLRVIDHQGDLRTEAGLPAVEVASDPDPSATYLMWTGQKGKGPDQENRFSIDPEGQVRGLNIPTELKLLSIGFSTRGSGGLQAANLKVGDVIGKEIGFGRGSQPGAPQTGTALSPFLFEGVAEYSFKDEGGRRLGAITTNVLEGRRFDVTLARASNETSWRFGFFGPIIFGSGCFHGATGMFYGASGSIFNPPPGDHVITHLYFARIDDPDGRFRASLRNVRR